MGDVLHAAASRRTLMQPSESQQTTLTGLLRFGGALALLVLPACQGTMPSARLQTEVHLPVPALADTAPSSDRLSSEPSGERYVLSARSVIPIAFDRQPDIKSSFRRFKSEEARYDFFYTSRDSLTPRLRASNQVGESRESETVTRTREHTVGLSIEKRFFDTTQLDAEVGYRTDSVDEDIGNHPFISAKLRYPLWASREKLERTSEDIFRRNELDDTQLSYIQEVRGRLQDVLFRFYEVQDQRRRVDYLRQWLQDLEGIQERFRAMGGPGTNDPPQPPEGGSEPALRGADDRRLQAEIARVSSEVRNLTGRYEIDVERFKGACGLPFHAEVELTDEPFNPFEGAGHQELLRLSIETDPEIATLRNAMRNAEVQLDLARRGTWDIAVVVSGESNLEGRGEDAGESDWSASLGLDVSHVDPRVTNSLTRQAQANIARFAQAITARENMIFVDTLEPLVRIETLGASRDELTNNLPRYKEDYQTGVEMYVAGTLNIDDLLKRRENVFEQQEEISDLIFLVGANVAELCSATGKFFELLNREADSPGSEQDVERGG
jgi:hypothetical protein